MRPAVRNCALVLVLALVALLRWPSLDLPLDRDEGEYATIAQQWPGGALPYRDLLEQKPPLVPLLYRAALAPGGEAVASVRTLAIVWQVATAAALFALVRRRGGDCAGLAAATLYAVASCGTRVQGLTANTESFVALPVALALLAMSRQSPTASGASGRRAGIAAHLAWPLAAGVLVGIASLAKQPAALALVALPFLVPPGTRARWRALGLGAAGAALPWLAVLAYFWARGAVADAYRCLVSYNLAYAVQGAAGWMERAIGAGRYVLAEQGGLWLLAGVGAVRRRGSGLAPPFVAWLAAAALGLGGGGRFYPHYFLVTVAPLACLAGLALARGERGGAGPLALRLAAAAIVALAVVRTTWPAWTARSGRERSVRIFGIPNFAAAGVVATDIDGLDPGGRSLWIWGSEAELFALTRRRPANRFLFDYPFTGDAPAYPGGDSELLASLVAPATHIAVVADRLDGRGALGDEIAAILAREYQPATRRGPFVVLVRRR